MKKFLFLPFTAFLLVCCSEGLAVEEVSDIASADHHISLEQALDELDVFLSALNVSTRAEGVTRRYSMEDIHTVRSVDVSVRTRGGSVGGGLPEEMLYLVNFDGGLGGAVLSADDRVSDVVMCVTESGGFSVSDFVAAGEFLNSVCTGGVSVRSSANDGGWDDDEEDEDDGDGDGGDDDDDDDYFEDMGELTVPVLLLTSLIEGYETAPDSVNKDSEGMINKGDGSGGLAGSKEGIGYSPSGKYGPYVKTKWGQAKVGDIKVFNRYTPNYAAAGCVTIAVAQILLATKNGSYTFTYDGCECVFDTMLTVANYEGPTNAGTDDAQEQAGKFVRGLGKRKYCNIDYGDNEEDESSGNIRGAKRTLKKFSYDNVRIRRGFGDTNQSLVTSQIKNGLPVYFRGCVSGTNSGHAWVLDGVWNDYYHINWGWNGRSDGYFTMGLFNSNDRQDYDETVDEKTQDSDMCDYDFSWKHKMILYTK